MKKIKILVISGATASGKSALALQKAQQEDGVVINADASQLYSELPILSAQPSKDDQKIIPHFLYSILKHNENSSVALWLEMAIAKINEVLEAGKLPIVVGGTGLYISKLINGINQIPEIDTNLRSEIRYLIKNIQKEELLKILEGLGDDFPNLEKLDNQRLARRLEVLKQTGKTLSYWHLMPNKTFYPQEYFEHLNVEINRDELYQNCNNRFKIMFENGAIEEVENLIKKNPAENSMITKIIGFLEIRDYLQGKIDREKVIEIASKKTRNYAKRQLTWFRNQFS